ncbi:MAG: LCP family protein [Cyanobacteriota bacterium]|nr:LCP family protein [Cyanobacteriota bacterium]
MAERRKRRSPIPNPNTSEVLRKLPGPRPSWPGPGLATLALVGALTGAGLLGVIWPKPDRSAHLREEITAETLAPKPSQPVTVLVIGSDADQLGGSSNGAAPPGPPNGDTVLLVRVNPQGPVQVLQLPSELALSLPGRPSPVALGDVYRLGGVALTAETVRELLNLDRTAPQRYMVVSRKALRELVDGVGGVEVSPPQRLKYTDKTLKYSIDLPSGLQRLSGAKVEQMVRYRDKWLGEAGRRSNQRLVLDGIKEQLGRSEQLALLPNLVTSWRGQVETNLNPNEMLSLLAIGLDKGTTLQFRSLPLKPPNKEFGDLRQLDPQAPRPLWPEPSPSESSSSSESPSADAP